MTSIFFKALLHVIVTVILLNLTKRKTLKNQGMWFLLGSPVPCTSFPYSIMNSAVQNNDPKALKRRMVKESPTINKIQIKGFNSQPTQDIN